MCQIVAVHATNPGGNVHDRKGNRFKGSRGSISKLEKARFKMLWPTSWNRRSLWNNKHPTVVFPVKPEASHLHLRNRDKSEHSYTNPCDGSFQAGQRPCSRQVEQHLGDSLWHAWMAELYDPGVTEEPEPRGFPCWASPTDLGCPCNCF